MKRFKNLIAIGIICVVPILLILFDLSWYCPVKRIFGIACPGCGLTRAFRCLFQFKIIESFQYNLLGIPLLVLGFFLGLLFGYDFIRNRDYFINQLYRFLPRYLFIIFFILIVNMIINNVRGI